MYSQTKLDIKDLRYILIVTHVRSNHANLQRFSPIDKGEEAINCPFFSVESKNQLYNKTCQFNHLSMFPMHIHKNGRFSSLFHKNTLNSDSKKFPGQMTGVKLPPISQSLEIR